MENVKNGNKILGQRVAVLRKQAGMTQEQLSEKLYFSSSKTVAAMENGRRSITGQTAKLLSELFGVDENYFLDTDAFPSPAAKYRYIHEKGVEENAQMLSAIVSLSKLNCFDVEISDIGAGLQVDTVLERINNYLRISKDGKELCSLSVNDANKVGNALNDTFLMIIHRFFIDD